VKVAPEFEPGKFVKGDQVRWAGFACAGTSFEIRERIGTIVDFNPKSKRYEIKSKENVLYWVTEDRLEKV
jgi:hypothetical protein